MRCGCWFGFVAFGWAESVDGEITVGRSREVRYLPWVGAWKRCCCALYGMFKIFGHPPMMSLCDGVGECLVCSCHTTTEALTTCDVDEDRMSNNSISTFLIVNLTNKHRSFLSSKKDAMLSIVQQDKTAVVRYRTNTTPHGEPAISDQSTGKC